MKRRKRIHRTKHSRGTPSAQKLAEWRTAGKCMKIPYRDDLVSIAEWRRWFRYQGKYQDVNVQLKMG